MGQAAELNGMGDVVYVLFMVIADLRRKNGNIGSGAGRGFVMR